MNVRLAEGLLEELDEWVQLCHDEKLLINRSDLIAIILQQAFQDFAETVSEYRMEYFIHMLVCNLEDYYMDYDLSVRRKNGVE